MIMSPDILAALARERVNTFLGEARAAHQATLGLMSPPGHTGHDQAPQPVSQPC